MYEDIHGVRDFEFTIQNYMEVQEEKFMEQINEKIYHHREVYRLC